jgi:mannose/fructose/N-acetylgalactosamine-specific phosphotransferase system component IID
VSKKDVPFVYFPGESAVDAHARRMKMEEAVRVRRHARIVGVILIGALMAVVSNCSHPTPRVDSYSYHR